MAVSRERTARRREGNEIEFSRIVVTGGEGLISGRLFDGYQSAWTPAALRGRRDRWIEAQPRFATKAIELPGWEQLTAMPASVAAARQR